MRPVLALLNLSFGPMRDRQGRIISDRFSLSQSKPFAKRLGMVSHGFIPGFVWEESGRIVGNVTLLESPIRGRYLIANVAVHPSFRRRGIARGLMHEALAHIESWRGHQVYLQVESDNAAAINLYNTLAFDEIGTVARWQATANRLRPPAPELVVGPRPRPLRKREWQAARELDRLGFNPDLNWPAPPAPDYYRSGFLRRLGDLLNGRRQETWIVEVQDGQEPKLVGLADIVSEWGRPHYLRLCIAPSWQDRVEASLLDIVVRRLSRFHGGVVWLNMPTGDSASDSLLQASNFQLRRSLTVMKKNLRAV